MITDLNERTRQILKLVIDAYVETGAPVGSASIARKSGLNLSPATIRSAMADLEDMGLLYSPHTSAGRLPTGTGLNVFVEGLLELDPLPEGERRRIEDGIRPLRGQSLNDTMEQTSHFLSGLSSCAGLVFAPKTEDSLRQIEFVQLAHDRVLAVLVTASGAVENRLIETPAGVTVPVLMRASNYLNARIANRTLPAAADAIRAELAADKTQLDELTAKVVESGIASLAPKSAGGHLFVRGQANLLNDITAIEDLERIRSLFDALETKETMLRLLQDTSAAEGVKIFIGAENSLFSHSGCSMVVAPYKTMDSRVVGAIGVIGPARLNYGRIIPVINYASLMMGRMMG